MYIVKFRIAEDNPLSNEIYPGVTSAYSAYFPLEYKVLDLGFELNSSEIWGLVLFIFWKWFKLRKYKKIFKNPTNYRSKLNGEILK